TLSDIYLILSSKCLRLSGALMSNCASRQDRKSPGSAGLKFLHKSGITLRPGGTLEISRWGSHWDCDSILSSPEAPIDRCWSVAPPGLGGSTGLAPVVPPPANLHRASGAKTGVETLAAVFAAWND